MDRAHGKALGAADDSGGRQRTAFWPRTGGRTPTGACAGWREDVTAELDRLLPWPRPRMCGASPEDAERRDCGAVAAGGPGRTGAGARNRAPACALATFRLETAAGGDGDSVFSSDHVFRDHVRFSGSAAAELAASGERIGVLGVPPTRAETGFGYIDSATRWNTQPCPAAMCGAPREAVYGEAGAGAAGSLLPGNYAWNGGIFLWSARTPVNAIGVLPGDGSAAGEDRRGRCSFACAVQARLRRSVSALPGDEHRLRGAGAALGQGETVRIYCLPADFAWND